MPIKVKKLILILTVFFLGLTSCQKEDIKPKNDVIKNSEIELSISVFGDWLLVDGQMYMENLETGEKTVYNHFDSNKKVSSLRYDGWLFNFERIVDDSTMWSFRAPIYGNTGEFWLDMDSIAPYGFLINQNNISIIEHPNESQKLGGSSRPLTGYINEDNDQAVDFYVQETYASIDGYNYKYFSKLTFKKQ